MSRVAVCAPATPRVRRAILAGLDENDPHAMAQWVRKMSRDIGEPLDAEMQTELERMESGEISDNAFEEGAEAHGGD